MLELRGYYFDWDREKNLANIKKHGVTFQAAAKAFFDTNAVILDDDEHSYDEDRFLLIGYSESERLLTVCHCYRHDGEIIRIISARKANKAEQKFYGGAANGYLRD